MRQAMRCGSLLLLRAGYSRSGRRARNWTREKRCPRYLVTSHIEALYIGWLHVYVPRLCSYLPDYTGLRKKNPLSRFRVFFQPTTYTVLQTVNCNSKSRWTIAFCNIIYINVSIFKSRSIILFPPNSHSSPRTPLIITLAPRAICFQRESSQADRHKRPRVTQ